jgi:hypothetical protein
MTQWFGKNSAGQDVASGLYLLRAPSKSAKIAVIR